MWTHDDKNPSDLKTENNWKFRFDCDNISFCSVLFGSFLGIFFFSSLRTVWPKLMIRIHFVQTVHTKESVWLR